ncbi:MAG: hypothetical protein LBR23_01865 [Spirochaetaceae bacterium]|nr:hypothetical protein [Spirochaetaceae bacterium]
MTSYQKRLENLEAQTGTNTRHPPLGCIMLDRWIFNETDATEPETWRIVIDPGVDKALRGKLHAGNSLGGHLVGNDQPDIDGARRELCRLAAGYGKPLDVIFSKRVTGQLAIYRRYAAEYNTVPGFTIPQAKPQEDIWTELLTPDGVWKADTGRKQQK